MEEAIIFQLQLSGEIEVTRRAGQVGENSLDLNRIPTEYHNYAEVFSKNRSKQLPPYCPYDLTI